MFLRKAFPHAFTGSNMPNFTDVEIIIHPNYEKRQELKERQDHTIVLSHSKSKRLNRKNVA